MPVWFRLSPSVRTDYDTGVNFVLRINDQYPDKINDVTPLYVRDSDPYPQDA